MISFRFHVVSITAVFLAIAIGVVVGSTYVDRAIVDTLRNRIETVSNNLDERKAENDELDRRLGESDAAVEAGAPFAVTERLTDVPVLILATRGIDEDAAAGTVLLARRAGGIVPGVVWLEPKWALEGDGDLAELAEIVDASSSASAETVREDAWEAVAEELVLVEETDAPAGEGTDPSTTTTTTTTVADAPAEVLAALVDAGFLSLDTLDDDATGLAELAGTGAGTILLTGTEAASEVTPLVPVIVDAALGADLDAVVGDVFVEQPDGPSRGEAITAALSEDQRSALGLVDAADLPQGQLAAVLALDAIADGVPGHFGYGSGADGLLPPWSPP